MRISRKIKIFLNIFRTQFNIRDTVELYYFSLAVKFYLSWCHKDKDNALKSYSTRKIILFIMLMGMILDWGCKSQENLDENPIFVLSKKLKIQAFDWNIISHSFNTMKLFKARLCWFGKPHWREQTSFEDCLRSFVMTTVTLKFLPITERLNNFPN